MTHWVCESSCQDVFAVERSRSYTLQASTCESLHQLVLVYVLIDRQHRMWPSTAVQMRRIYKMSACQPSWDACLWHLICKSMRSLINTSFESTHSQWWGLSLSQMLDANICGSCYIHFPWFSSHSQSKIYHEMHAVTQWIECILILVTDTLRSICEAKASGSRTWFRQTLCRLGIHWFSQFQWKCMVCCSSEARWIERGSNIDTGDVCFLRAKLAKQSWPAAIGRVVWSFQFHWIKLMRLAYQPMPVVGQQENRIRMN